MAIISRSPFSVWNEKFQERRALKLLTRAWLLIALTAAAHAQEFSIDLAELSLEELMDVEVFTVSRKEGKLSESAAAVFVLTAEDVRQTGATSIPEALRMVPGMEVARIDASKWAVSSRGFNDVFANKLLVLIDGRSVYSPLFSGVLWDTQDVSFEDMERIEVIRGPGATLWGANAVNGIINVLSKSARDTQGGMATVGLGSEESRSGNVRYGGQLGDDLYYRLYARRVERDDFALASGEEAADGWEVVDATPPEMERCYDLWGRLVGEDFPSTLAALGDVMSPDGAHLLRSSIDFWPAGEVAPQEVHAERMRLGRQWAMFLDEHPVLVLPTWYQPPFAHHGDVSDDPTVVRALYDAVFTLITPANMLGLPATQVPVGCNDDGVPLGVQFMADRHREDRTLVAAAVAEAAHPPITPIDPVRT